MISITSWYKNPKGEPPLWSIKVLEVKREFISSGVLESIVTVGYLLESNFDPDIDPSQPFSNAFKRIGENPEEAARFNYSMAEKHKQLIHKKIEPLLNTYFCEIVHIDEAIKGYEEEKIISYIISYMD